MLVFTVTQAFSVQLFDLEAPIAGTIPTTVPSSAVYESDDHEMCFFASPVIVAVIVPFPEVTLYVYVSSVAYSSRSAPAVLFALL